MKRFSEYVLQDFLLKCGEQRRDHLISFLSPKERESLASVPVLSQQFVSEKLFHENLLDYIHYSWFLPTLKSYEPSDVVLFLSALSVQQRGGLEKILNSSSQPEEKISWMGMEFLRKILLTSLLGEEKNLLPVEYLPESPLNFLLKLSKIDWVRLIDALGLYDLLAELQQTIETQTLKKIEAVLSEPEKRFLKSKTAYKEPVHFSRISLQQWDGKAKTLKVLLHKRGLYRLAYALGETHEDFVWYVCHRLDIGRGSLLATLGEKKKEKSIVEWMMGQVLELCSLMQIKGD